MFGFESLSEDISSYLLNGEPFVDRARNVTAIDSRPYQDYYTPKTIQIIADWYKDDIDHFGFDFDTPATKNIWSTS